MPGSRRTSREAPHPAHRPREVDLTVSLSAADLQVPGAGEELIAHLTAVLAGLDRLAPVSSDGAR